MNYRNSRHLEARTGGGTGKGRNKGRSNGGAPVLSAVLTGGGKRSVLKRLEALISDQTDRSRRRETVI